MIEQSLRDRLDRPELEIPMLPAVAVRILKLVSSEDTDAKDLSGVIHGDPALAAHVLRIANSPLFMSSVPIVSLRQAVARLGVKQLAQVALTASIQARAFQARGFERLAEALRDEAVRCGAWAQEVARALRTNPETAFLCGLVHRIGVPISLQALADVARTQNETVAPDDALALVEEHQACVGSRVVEKWGLAKTIAAVIRGEESDTGRIVAAARALATHEPEEVSEHPALADANLYPEDVEALLSRADAVAQTASLMGGR